MSDQANLPNGLGVPEAVSHFEAFLAGQSDEQPPANDEAPENEDADTDAGDDEVTDEATDDADADEADAGDEGDDDDENGDGEKAEADGDDTGDGDEKKADAEPPKHTLKVQGQEIEVTQDQLYEFARKGVDYTQKTQKVAEQAKEVSGLRDTYLRGLQVIEAQLNATQPKKPDLVRLSVENPAEAVRQNALYQQWRESIAVTQQEIARVEADRERAEGARRAEYLQQQSEQLPKINPDWEDAEKFQSDSAQMRDYLQSIGAPDGSDGYLTDAWMIRALWDAARYRAQAEKKPVEQPKPVRKPAPAVAKPGSAATAPRRNNALTKAKQRLAQTGSVADAAAAFEALL